MNGPTISSIVCGQSSNGYPHHITAALDQSRSPVVLMPPP